MFFVTLGFIGLTYPNASAMALAPFSRNAGTAAALTGFIQIGVAAIASACTGFFNATSSVPIIAMLPATSIIACLVFFGLKRKVQL
jgi:DHA1 family bicyclomycin/chloramphenicol resistance-like MFS transporter